jgi:hypothetical protein
VALELELVPAISVQWIGDDGDVVTEWRRRCSAVTAAVLPVAHSATLKIG